jgi:hypothetical protein
VAKVFSVSLVIAVVQLCFECSHYCEMEFITTKRGGKKVVKDEYVYGFNGKAKYRRMNERLAAMKERLNVGDINVMQYLDAIKYFAPLELDQVHANDE